VADGWCWSFLKEEYCWLVAGGWFVLREKYCWLVADKPSEQAQGVEIEDADVAPDGEGVVLEQGLSPPPELLLADEVVVAAAGVLRRLLHILINKVPLLVDVVVVVVH
jgi:hypothetical protein